MAKKISSREEDWQADVDVETLLRFQELQQDQKRMQNAVKRAQEKAQKAQQNSENIKAMGGSLTGTDKPSSKIKKARKKSR